jgi:Uma2 family endonuclease
VHLTLPKIQAPVTLCFDPATRLSDDAYFAFCMANRDLRIERSVARVSNEALARLSKQERRRFPRLAPEFIVEVMSPSDRLKQAKEKMEQWLANGVQLGWLVHGDARTVYVYREGRPSRTRRGIAQLADEGPVRGFLLQLAAIWEGL